jgi:hypothetical protein
MDLREPVAAAIDQCGSQHQVARRFGVSQHAPMLYAKP